MSNATDSSAFPRVHLHRLPSLPCRPQSFPVAAAKAQGRPEADWLVSLTTGEKSKRIEAKAQIFFVGHCPAPLAPLRHKSPQLQPPPVVMAETSSGGLKPRGLLGLLGGSLIHLSCGSMYCWGNLLSYMPPELKYWGGAMGGAAAAGGVPDAQFVLAFTILSQMVGMPIGRPAHAAQWLQE